ncbi:DUF2844 domain-containing protein [Paraburkholderia solisilvae]|uniref:DUF2844 domain-containing protein n=1 Tax=Paraburkholderia solisilvae TaxID=624376 RepID=A0A6J5DIS4_9BURK|nr:DUF2844 domain-containing protein [Paraburkholderia solisilvae]CAB3754150.1 hypothetical protein LMG29739_01907 [Paraburkholderia solisilvae]
METGKRSLKWRFVGLAAVVSIGFAANAAVAALGGFPLTGANPHVTSNVMKAAALVQTSTPSQAAAAASSANALYSVNVVVLKSGTVVHEYVATSSNTVFAVIWNGPRQPNFADILGAYSTRYLTPSGLDVIRVGGLSQRGLSSPDLVVQSFGRMGRFKGYAYLPSAVPPGVSLTELQ